MSTERDDLVTVLREKAAGKRNRVGDFWGDWICGEAADRIAADEALLRQALEALRCTDTDANRPSYQHEQNAIAALRQRLENK